VVEGCDTGFLLATPVVVVSGPKFLGFLFAAVTMRATRSAPMNKWSASKESFSHLPNESWRKLLATLIPGLTWSSIALYCVKDFLLARSLTKVRNNLNIDKFKAEKIKYRGKRTREDSKAVSIV